MTRLLRILRHHSDALEADLLDKGLDLLDYWRGTLSLRRLLVIYRHLPPESATRQVEHGKPWTLTHDLLDALRMTIRWAYGDKAPSPHPASPAGALQAAAAEAARAKHLAALDRARAEKRERERRIAAGEIT